MPYNLCTFSSVVLRYISAVQIDSLERVCYKMHLLRFIILTTIAVGLTTYHIISVSSVMSCILGHAGSVECKLKSAEWQVWKKSQQCDGFPHRDVIDEFLTDKDKLPAFAFVWKRPKMFHLMVNNMYLCILYVYLLFVNNFQTPSVMLHCWQLSDTLKPGYVLGIVGKCLGPTAPKRPMKDGCIIYHIDIYMHFSGNLVKIGATRCQI